MSGAVYYVSIPMPRPIGGFHVLAEHVALLRREGVNAALWHPEPPAGVPASDDDAVVEANSLRILEDDLLVVPEPVVTPGVEPAPGARKVIFNQNHFFTFAQWEDQSPYPQWPSDPDVWVVSRESQEVLSRLFPHNPARLVPNSVDAELFRADQPRDSLISWMPRKRRYEASLLERLFRADKRAAGVEFQEMSSLSREDVARTLARTSVFLSLAHTESFGLPVAEALLAGCLVVGYSGGGGEHLFEAPGAWLIPEQRPVLLVEKALELLADPASEALRQQNRDWVMHHYPQDATRSALLEGVRDARQRPGGEVVAVHPLLTMAPPDPSFGLFG